MASCPSSHFPLGPLLPGGGTCASGQSPLGSRGSAQPPAVPLCCAIDRGLVPHSCSPCSPEVLLWGSCLGRAFRGPFPNPHVRREEACRERGVRDLEGQAAWGHLPGSQDESWRRREVPDPLGHRSDLRVTSRGRSRS